MCLAAVSVSLSVMEVLECELLSFTDSDSGGTGSVYSTAAVGGFSGLGGSGEDGWMIASSSSSWATDSTLLREEKSKEERAVGMGIAQDANMFSTNSN